MQRRKIFFYFLIVAGLSFFSCRLTEEQEYKKAEKENTIQAFEEFLKKYPKGEYSRSARGHLALLYFQRAAKEDTISAYEDYIARFPDSRLRPEAVRKLMKMLEPEINKLTPEQMKKLRAVIQTDYGEIWLRFYPEKAPDTCRNFIKLARSHFYDLSQFHLIIPGELIQGGAPRGDPRGGPGYTIKAEFNDLPHTPGAVGMARRSLPDTAGSQFYICLTRLPERDGKYTIFAYVEKGLKVARRISFLPNNGPDGKPYPFKPLEPVIIRSIKIVSPEKEGENGG